MSRKIAHILYSADNRYPNADEEQLMLDYASSLPARVRAMREVEQHELQIVKSVIAAMRERYPSFQGFHDKAWGKAYRDIQLVIRYQCQAMLLEEVSYLDEKVLVWLRTILASFNFTPQFNRDTYSLLMEAYSEQLSAAAFAAIRPYAEHTVEVMADFPEPATPMV